MSTRNWRTFCRSRRGVRRRHERSLVDDVQERFAAGETLEVGEEPVHHTIHPADRVPGHVGRDHDSLHVPEGVLRRQRLLLEHVERRARHVPGAQSLEQRLLVDQGPRPMFTT
jgi:hypothetical protein